MYRIIKQNYATLSPEKKVIQNIGELRPAAPKQPKEDNALIRVALDAAENLNQDMEEAAIRSEAEWTAEIEARQAEAERILEDANAAKAKIYEDAYNTGMAKAKEELERRQAILEQEYADKKDSVEKELRRQYQSKYAEQLRRLEGDMILWLKGMLEKLVGEASQKEETLIYLVRMGLQEISLQGDLIIRVSGEDLNYVLEHKAELTEELSEKLTIEVLKDKALKKNQCIIETVMGNIECSLDVQLKGIVDELRLIYESIMKNENRN